MSGFGGSDRHHRERYGMLLDRVEGHLDSAERIIRGGDCESAINSVVAAFEEYGEMLAHRRELGATRLEGRARKVGVRLNFLRQSLKGCVR